MKLSELLALEQTPVFVSGLVIDTSDEINPPKGLKEAGVLLQINDGGEVDENILDVIISYKIAGVSVFMEIPFALSQNEGFKKMGMPYLLTMASNIGVGIVFLPPQTDPLMEVADENWQHYLKLSEDLSEVYFTKENFDQMLLPVTSYLEYLYVEVILGSEKMRAFQPKDEYIQEKFNYIHPTLNHWFKDKLREKIYLIFEGRENFEENAKGLMEANYNLITDGALKTRKFYVDKAQEMEDQELKAAEKLENIEKEKQKAKIDQTQYTFEAPQDNNTGKDTETKH